MSRTQTTHTDWDSVLQHLTAIGVAIVGALAVTGLLSFAFIDSEHQAAVIGGGALGTAVALCLVFFALSRRGPSREVTTWAPFYLLLPLNIAGPAIFPWQNSNIAWLCWSAAGGVMLFGIFFAVGLLIGRALIRRLNSRPTGR